jgi:nucleoside-diphosphate-sugar epimerase
MSGPEMNRKARLEPGRRALVTGGGGFLGTSLCRQLRQAGWQVRSLSRSRYDHLEPLGVEQVRGDLADAGVVHQAAGACDIVFHNAARASMGGPYERFFATNVVGTQNVIAACRARGIARLVFTSSPSVAYDARTPVRGADERLPYPKSYLAHYPCTKAIAERVALAANGGDLAVVALRPHLIWGPGDNHLVPQIVARARAGRLRLINGGRALVDTVYVEDAARAHLLAAERLEPGAACAGRAYFITQGNPIAVGEMINQILAAAGVSPVRRSVPLPVAYAAGWLLETWHRCLRRPGEPLMTRFLALQLGTDHWFDISAARRDLGYEPQTSLQDGLSALASWLRENRLGSTPSVDRRWRG